MVTLKIEDLIRFYDEKDKNISHQVSSITGIIGEDLGAGLVKHYFDNQNRTTEIIDEHPKQGGKTGKWLDRWIKVKNIHDNNFTYYQTEIKNWSSHSIGGKKIPLNAQTEELKAFAIASYNGQWDSNKNTLKHEKVVKVLSRMKSHSQIIEKDTIKPLIVFWFPLHDKENDFNQALFEVKCNSGTFTHVTFFSMSIYLRKLLNDNITEIQIEAPNIEIRKRILDEMII